MQVANKGVAADERRRSAFGLRITDAPAHRLERNGRVLWCLERHE